MKIKIVFRYSILLLIMFFQLNTFLAGDSFWKNSPTKIKIDDNLSYIYQQDTTSQLTIIHLLFKGGKRAEPENKKGLSYLSNRLTLEIPDRRKIQKLMTLSSSFLLKVYGDYSIITIRCLSKKFGETMELFSKIFSNPLYSSLRINRIKKAMFYYQRMEKDNTILLMNLTYLNSFFSNTPYEGSVYGNQKSLKLIKTKDIKKYHKQNFNLSNMILSVSTDLDAGETTKILKIFFGKFPVGSEIKPMPISQSSLEKREYFIKKDKEQTLISMATLLPELSAENYAYAFLMDNLLSKGLGSKLWVLRSKNNLAYSVHSRITYLKKKGLLTVFLNTENRKKEEARSALKNLLLDMYKKGITEEELDMTKTNSKADFLRFYETKENRSSNMVYFEAMGLGYQFLEKLPDHLDRITSEGFNHFIKKVLNPENLVEVIIGPENLEIPAK